MLSLEGFFLRFSKYTTCNLGCEAKSLLVFNLYGLLRMGLITTHIYKLHEDHLERTLHYNKIKRCL